MKTELTPEDLAKAIQFLKDSSIPEDAVCLNRLVGWLNAPRLDQALADKARKEGFFPPILEVGYTFHDGVNTKTYRGGGVWETTLVHVNRGSNE